MALAEQALTEAIRVGREHGSNVDPVFRTRGAKPVIFHCRAGDFAAARRYAEESRGPFSEKPDWRGQRRMPRLVLARIATLQGQWDEARRRMPWQRWKFLGSCVTRSC